MKPLLSASKLAKPADIRLPTYASIKYDGIRCCMVDGVAMSRTGKPIPNRFVQSQLQGLHGLDGELLLADHGKDFNDQQSAFMSQSGQPDFVYLVFDYWDSHKMFMDRLDEVYKVSQSHPRTQMVLQHYVQHVNDLVELYNNVVADGYEGLICRLPQGKYKQGRSTPKEQYSMKLKPVKMGEAKVIGFEELIDQAGRPQNTLGAFKVIQGTVQFQIGTGLGLTAIERKAIWTSRERYLGKLVSFQYQELSKDGVPRFPSWRGFRYD